MKKRGVIVGAKGSSSGQNDKIGKERLLLWRNVAFGASQSNRKSILVSVKALKLKSNVISTLNLN